MRKWLPLATDLTWIPGVGYGFNLLVRETRGTDITFDEIELFFGRPNSFPYQGRFTGLWRLAANDQFRIPLGSTTAEAQLWRVTMKGLDSQGYPSDASGARERLATGGDRRRDFLGGPLPPLG